ncbi:MAG: hypothetical protein V4597_19365 [Pseudomonadota bacterium]
MPKKSDGKYGLNVYVLACGHHYNSARTLCNGMTAPCGQCNAEGRPSHDGTPQAEQYSRQPIQDFIGKR